MKLFLKAQEEVSYQQVIDVLLSGKCELKLCPKAFAISPPEEVNFLRGLGDREKNLPPLLT